MAEPWEQRWRPLRGAGSGGQARGFLATATDGSNRRAFVKVLQRPKDVRARARFRREAAAYETLAGLGPPELIEHNAEAWNDRGTRLYMVLEFVDGVSLKDWSESGGRASMADALSCVRALGLVLEQCHANGVTHRDVKPSNVMLRGREISQPVLVDFGLSFNNADEDDLTRVGEEVGNRFLRLPEHATGGRAATSDITQLAGVFLYAVTGVEPRVLVDEAGRRPHQRAGSRDQLESLLAGRQLTRVLSVLDKAFANELDRRYPSAGELVAALEVALTDDAEGDDLDALLRRVDEIATGPVQESLAQQRATLTEMILRVSRVVKSFAVSRSLELTQTAQNVSATSSEAWAETKLSVVMHGESPNWVHYRIFACGVGEFELLVDGASAWRGTADDAALDEAVQRMAAAAFLRSRKA